MRVNSTNSNNGKERMGHSAMYDLHWLCVYECKKHLVTNFPNRNCITNYPFNDDCNYSR